MSIEKKYLIEKGVCKVTFRLPSSIADTASKARVMGEFSNWDPTGIPMKKSKNGKFSLSLELPIDSEYQFRYLVDGTRWETDWEADSLSPVPGSDEFNSVVKL